MSLKNKIRGLKEIWQFENRLPLILTRTLFPRERLYVYRYKGVEFLTDVAGGDANGARQVLTSPMYLRFLPQMTFDGPINVLDIGANNGGFPLLLAAHGVRIKKVVAVELNPNTFLRLRFNLERNLDCEVVTLNAAICGEARSLNVSLGEGSSGDSIYNGSSASGRKAFEIEGVTVDDVCDRHFERETIDICKIDIEGAEFEVFSHPLHECLRRCRYLIMEIHEGEGRSPDKILPALARIGFVPRLQPPDADPAVFFFANSNFE
ncbi:MAG TPA: FkbM family methyltransferase [Pyrinomonadaceae bacterium]